MRNEWKPIENQWETKRKRKKNNGKRMETYRKQMGNQSGPHRKIKENKWNPIENKLKTHWKRMGKQWGSTESHICEESVELDSKSQQRLQKSAESTDSRSQQREIRETNRVRRVSKGSKSQQRLEETLGELWGSHSVFGKLCPQDSSVDTPFGGAFCLAEGLRNGSWGALIAF